MYRRLTDDAVNLTLQVFIILRGSTSDYATQITAAVDVFFLQHADCSADMLREARELVSQLDWEFIKSVHPNGVTVERECHTVGGFEIPNINSYNSITNITVNDGGLPAVPHYESPSIQITHSLFSLFWYCSVLTWLKLEPCSNLLTEEIIRYGFEKFRRACEH
jgi:hypothetical protein